MFKYFYEGPVFIFNKIATDHWRGETTAPSYDKARSNLVYQFKKKHNLAANSKVTLLPNKLKQIG